MYDLAKSLPTYYKTSKIMSEIINTQQSELNNLISRIGITQNQFFVMLADINMSLYESDVGVLSYANEDIEVRRSRVLSKLRATNTVTKSVIKNIASAFINGEVEITEYPNEYAFEIKFVSKIGIPKNIVDLQKIIEDIKPAHLEVRYSFVYRTWYDCETVVATWENAKLNFTWEGLTLLDVVKNLYIENGSVYYRQGNDGNAVLVYAEDGTPYARIYEGGLYIWQTKMT